MFFRERISPRLTSRLPYCFLLFLGCWVLLGTSTISLARFSFAPYFSIRSTKSVNPGAKDTETEKINQRQEMGIRGALSFYNFFKLEVGVGQSKLTKTEKTSEVVDEYDEVDFESDLNMSTDDPDKEVKTTDTQNRAKFSFIFDPSFSIFIARLKIGVTAQQRIVQQEEVGQPGTEVTKGPTYKPHSGLGLGVRLTPGMYFMIEYSAYHYKFPDVEPFERQLSVSYSVAI